MKIQRDGGVFGRGVLLVFLLSAQLFMPAHVLAHELSMEPAGACAICPVGQNLTGVSADAQWLLPAERFSVAPLTHETQQSPVAMRVLFHSRAPPSFS